MNILPFVLRSTSAKARAIFYVIFINDKLPWFKASNPVICISYAFSYNRHQVGNLEFFLERGVTRSASLDLEYFLVITACKYPHRFVRDKEVKLNVLRRVTMDLILVLILMVCLSRNIHPSRSI